MNTKELQDRAIIRPVKRAVEDELLDLPGVVAIDIGEKHTGGCPTGEQAILVSVRHKFPETRVEPGARVPGDILGIPIDVVEEQLVPHHCRCRVERRTAPHAGARADRGPTIVGGSGISPARVILLAPPDVDEGGEYAVLGTLGALVTAREPGSPAMGLTTFDTACMDDAWSVGDQMVDPGTSRVVAGLARAALSGRVDAAALTLAEGAAHRAAIAGVGPVTGPGRARIGEVLRKSGYGTGLTAGTVVSTDATLRVDHGAALGVRILREQIRVAAMPQGSRFSGPGDAGAALVNADGRVVGLHVAGNAAGNHGFASPIVDVLHELDVELCVAPLLPAHARGCPGDIRTAGRRGPAGGGLSAGGRAAERRFRSGGEPWSPSAGHGA